MFNANSSASPPESLIDHSTWSCIELAAKPLDSARSWFLMSPSQLILWSDTSNSDGLVSTGSGEGVTIFPSAFTGSLSFIHPYTKNMTSRTTERPAMHMKAYRPALITGFNLRTEQRQLPTPGDHCQNTYHRHSKTTSANRIRPDLSAPEWYFVTGFYTPDR